MQLARFNKAPTHSSNFPPGSSHPL